ncbi:ankyrin repeat domain-containing protein 39-like [Ptychodera flava]|uniref:ankyrin repeat domain-containing protein 39-like n=1 Tax=Ptychodera flava TaxID=63121 RepID=UPI00396A3D23
MQERGSKDLIKLSMTSRIMTSLKMAAPTDLATAAANGDLNSLRASIHEGADVNRRSSEGFVPLCIAAFWGYSDIAEYLLRHGADINRCNGGTGWTALHCAAFQGHGKVIMKLMEYNPKLDIRDAKGRTASDFASAMDAIWPFFASAGCRRTPKSELIRFDIIKKVQDDPVMPKSNYAIYSRPGSAYVMKAQPLRGDVRNARDQQREYAASTGDVLALHGEAIDSRSTSNPSFNIWRS